jgi:ribonucleoside-diphosphate reductase alpha chain
MIRRIGLGVTGLDTMLMELGLKYNSSEALEYVDSLMNFVKNCAYEASIELAIEKGSFPAFDADKFLQGGFAKTLKPSIRAKIKKHGFRNAAVLTLPPVGTGSMVCDCDSGVEKSFGPAWERRFRDGDELKTEVVVHPIFKKKYLAGEDVSHFQTVWDISVRDHFEMQRVCQKHIDNAVSKTINLHPGTSEQELSELYMEYFPELKGVTVYPEGSREDQPITPLSIEEALKHLDSQAQGARGKDSCRDGVCDI